MNNLVLSLLLCAVIGLSTAYWVSDPNSANGYGPDSEDDDDNDLLAYYKRSSADLANANLCIPWRAPCTQDQVLVDKYKFLRCCGRNSCRCTMWGNNCRCEAYLGR